MSNELFKRLSAPFPPSAVKWRVGRAFWSKSAGQPQQGQETTGLVLAYIDARDVMDRLDEVIGFGNWGTAARCVETKGGTAWISTISVRLGAEVWVDYEGVSDETDFEAIKGGASGAFKRAAVHMGIGRYLYGLGDTRAKLTYRSGGWQIKDEEYPKLEKLIQDHFASSNVAPLPANPLPLPPSEAPAGNAETVQQKNGYDFEKYRKEYVQWLIRDFGKEGATKIVAQVLDTFGISKYSELKDEKRQRDFIEALASKLKWGGVLSDTDEKVS